jgi:hypothetical protein
MNGITDIESARHLARRADLSAMTEAQLLELADIIRPHIDNDSELFNFWLLVLLATD